MLGQERLLKARTGQASAVAAGALAERELGRFLLVLEGQLLGREYLAGTFSLADIAVGAGLESCEARGIELTAYPQLFGWRQRLRLRPSCRE